MAKVKQEYPEYYLRHIRILLLIATLILTVHLFYLARDFFLPVIIAFLIAVTFRPAVRSLAVR